MPGEAMAPLRPALAGGRGPPAPLALALRPLLASRRPSLGPGACLYTRRGPLLVAARAVSGGGRPRVGPALPSAQLGGAPGGGWRTFWAAVDTSAWLGTVGTAVAFIITQEAMLAAAPVVLPLVALFASRQRQRLAEQAAEAAAASSLQQLLLQLSEETADEVAVEVEALLQQQQRQLGAVAPPAKLLRAVEGKLEAVEAAVQAEGSSTRRALQEGAAQQGRTAQEAAARVEAAAAALRRDVASGLRQVSSDELAALSRLEARLASLEGTISSLQASQAQALQQAVGEAAAAVGGPGAAGLQEALAAAVREEAARALSALATLPGAVTDAAAAGAADAAASLAAGGQLAVPTDAADLRAVLEEQLGGVLRRLEEQQAELVEDVAEELRSAPATVAPAQWNQLGGRLLELDKAMREVRRQQQQQAAVVAAAVTVVEGGNNAGLGQLAQDLAALRAELAPVAAAVAALVQGVGSGGFAAPSSAGSGAEVAAAIAAALEPFEAALATLRGEVKGLVALAASASGSRVDEEDESGGGGGSSPAVLLRALEGRLEGALQPVTQVLSELRQQTDGALASAAAAAAAAAEARGREGAGADAAAAAAASGAAAAATQAAAMEGVLQALAGLSQRLDAVGGQVAALQAAVEEQPLALTPSAGAAGQLPVAHEAPEQQERQEMKERPQKRGQSLTAEQAYQRMQALLKQQAEAEEEAAAGAAAAAADGSGSNGSASVPISSWLGGSGGVSASNGVQPSLAAALESAWPGAPGTSGAAAGGVQEQIVFAAAMGLAPEDEAEQEQQLPAEQPQQQLAAEQPQQQPAAAAERPQEQQRWQEGEEEQEWVEGSQGLAWQQQQAQQPRAQADAGAPPAAGSAAPPLQQQGQQQEQYGDPAQLYAQGLELLKRGRELAEALDASLRGGAPLDPSQSAGADEAFASAAARFEGVLTAEPGNVRALGNCGNALLAHGRLKKLQLDGLASEAAAWRAEEQARLAEEAGQLLLRAGRQYKAVLEADPQQARAFVNWGRALCLRAELARGGGDGAGAADLFTRAADKFDAALDLEPRNVQALRLAGLALLDAAVCTGNAAAAEAAAAAAAGGGAGGDAGAAGRQAACDLLADVPSYLRAVLAQSPGDREAAAKLAEAEELLALLSPEPAAT